MHTSGQPGPPAGRRGRRGLARSRCRQCSGRPTACRCVAAGGSTMRSMAAITQLRYKHSRGRAYADKTGEGKTHKALRSQAADQRRHLRPPPSRCPPGRSRKGSRSGRATGNGPDSGAAGSHPAHRLFGQDCECALWPRSREREWRRASGPPTLRYVRRFTFRMCPAFAVPLAVGVLMELLRTRHPRPPALPGWAHSHRTWGPSLILSAEWGSAAWEGCLVREAGLARRFAAPGFCGVRGPGLGASGFVLVVERACCPAAPGEWVRGWAAGGRGRWARGC
jgi:hypothetical protein